jgi:hypothetical protein
MVLRYGGAVNRSGTTFISEVSDSTKKVRLIPFQFNDDQTYVLEFGNLYMRVLKDGAQQFDANTISFSNITQTNPIEIETIGNHLYSTGDEVFIDNVEGMTELNGKHYKVVYNNATNFGLKDMDDNNIDSTGFTAYTTGGYSQRVYEIATPYTDSDVLQLNYIQSADVLTLVHPSHPPAELRRTSDINWSLADIAFTPITQPPRNGEVGDRGGTGFDFRWKVTAINAETGEESLSALAKDKSYTIKHVFQSNPCLVLLDNVSSGLEENDELYIENVQGMVELNNRVFFVENVFANIAPSWASADISGDIINSPIHNMVTGQEVKVSNGGTLPTPLQDGANDYYYVIKVDANNFKLATSQANALADVAITLGGSPTGTHSVTTQDTRIELVDIDSTGYGAFIYDSTSFTFQSTEIDITAGIETIDLGSAHGFSTGEEVRLIFGAVPPTPLVEDKSYYVILDADPNKVKLADTLEKAQAGDSQKIDITTVGTASTDNVLYTVDGVAHKAYIEIDNKAKGAEATPHELSWERSEEAKEYYIYRQFVATGKRFDGVYAQVGVSTGESFNDTDQTADAEFSPPTSRNPFVGTGNYPSTVTYIQQRLAFANSNNNTEKIYLSRTGNYKNFTRTSPSQPSDAITIEMAGRQVNSVKALIDLGKFVILTAGGEWSANGDVAGVLTPSDVNTRQYSYNGSGDLRPIIIDGAALYQQARGSIIRDLGFDFQVDGYVGNDLTIFNSHLFEKFTLLDWAYQQIPNSIVWVVRDDGTLLGMTFIRNQQVVAWHRHDLGGDVESVAVVSEGNEDVLYVSVKRTIDGNTKRYVERLNTRKITDIVEAKFMDSNISYDGRNTTATTMQLDLDGGGWTYTDTLTITSSTSYFAATDVGSEIHITNGDDIIRMSIDTYVSDTVVKGKPHKTVPASLQSTAVTSWSKAVKTVDRLFHLEGESVSILGDGFVVANPNNASYDEVQVTNGVVTLDKAYSVLHIGIPYITDLETLDVDTAEGETLSDKKKYVGKVTMFVEDTRGLWAGAKPPSDDTVDPLEDLSELKIRNDEDYESPIDLITDNVEIVIKPEWNSNGRVFVRQVDPLPMTILSINPSGRFPFR